ncbi:hypothetical protein LINPERPRIM_LOCUS29998 [Linum perenne]
MFFKILAHSNSARDNAKDFQHSATTVSKYVGIVLKAVISLSHVVIGPPNMSEVPPQILNDPKYYPYFKMRYTYVVAVWEGSSHDARILSSTTTDRNSQFPMPPLGMITIVSLGKCYVVDSGFAIAPGFLAPFRGYTSHFQEIRRQGGPKGHEKLFNYKHSSLRNVIEQCFGVLKKRWLMTLDLT